MEHLSETILNAWVDNVLPLDEASRVEAHLRDCPHCNRAARELRRLCSALETLPPAPAMEDLARRTTEAWKREKRADRRPWAGLRRPAAYAAVAAGLIIGMILGGLSQSLISPEAGTTGRVIRFQAVDTGANEEPYLRLLVAREDVEL